MHLRCLTGPHQVHLYAEITSSLTEHGLLHIYRKSSTPTSQYYEICSRFGQLSRRIMWLGYGLYMFLYVLFFIVGAYDMWRSNGESQIVHLYIPGIYVYSPIANGCLAILNTSLLTMCAIIVSPQDVLFYLVFGNVPLVTAIVRRQMNEVTELLKSKRPRSSGDVAFVKRHFMHYIGIHHKYNE